MNIVFLRAAHGLGYAYKAGATTGSLPDEVAQMLIDGGYAKLVGVKKRPKEKKPEVKTTHVTRSRKRPVK